jgi:hypothetical protein
MHRTHLPLTVWFWAIYLCATDKRGISAKALTRQLGLSYESAWYLLTRIRSAMRERDQRYLLEGEYSDGRKPPFRESGNRETGAQEPRVRRNGNQSFRQKGTASSAAASAERKRSTCAEGAEAAPGCRVFNNPAL